MVSPTIYWSTSSLFDTSMSSSPKRPETLDVSRMESLIYIVRARHVLPCLYCIRVHVLQKFLNVSRVIYQISTYQFAMDPTGSSTRSMNLLCSSLTSSLRILVGQWLATFSCHSGRNQATTRSALADDPGRVTG